MSLRCQNDDCGYEFDDAVGFDVLDAKEAGETPYFKHIHVPEDGFGVETSCYCSLSCLNADLGDQGDSR